ncbi:hypothetical protein ANANG_G00088640, partial [Anguilla anguilla]
LELTLFLTSEPVFSGNTRSSRVFNEAKQQKREETLLEVRLSSTHFAGSTGHLLVNLDYKYSLEKTLYAECFCMNGYNRLLLLILRLPVVHS